MYNCHTYHEFKTVKQVEKHRRWIKLNTSGSKMWRIIKSPPTLVNVMHHQCLITHTGE